MEYVYVIEAVYSYRDTNESWIECVVFDEKRVGEIIKELEKDKTYEYTDFEIIKTKVRG